MLNNVMLVGKVVKKTEDNRLIVIEIDRKSKDDTKSFESDLFDCYLPKSISNGIKDHCNIRSIVGIRGRLQNIYNNKKRYNIVVAESLSLLNSTN